MVSVSMPKRKPKLPKQPAPNESCSCFIFLFKFLYRVPTAFFFLFLIYLWSSSTTIISGNIVHVCVSSRMLNDHHCLSAGKTQPKFEIPIPIINHSSIYLHTLDKSFNLPIPLSPPLYHCDGSTSPRSTVGGEKVRETAEVIRDESDPVIIRNGENKDKVANAKKEAEEQMRLHRSWISDKKQAGCEGRGVYVYDLPSKFNSDLIGQCRDMVPWMDFCKYFKNEAMGEP